MAGYAMLADGLQHNTVKQVLSLHSPKRAGAFNCLFHTAGHCMSKCLGFMHLSSTKADPHSTRSMNVMLAVDSAPRGTMQASLSNSNMRLRLVQWVHANNSDISAMHLGPAWLTSS